MIGAAPQPRRTHIFKKDVNSHYVEPGWVSERLLEVEDFGPLGSRILDPCCGWGTILLRVQEAGYTPIGGDIYDRLKRGERGLNIEFHHGDFLRDPPAPDIVSIITNPPFELIREFAERAIDVARSRWRSFGRTAACRPRVGCNHSRCEQSIC